MGQLYYANSGSAIELPDDLLAHLKVVAATKLRRQESFTLTIRGTEGRETIWLQPSIPLRFVFQSAEPTTLDPALLQRLAESASSSAGVTVSPESDAASPARPKAA